MISIDDTPEFTRLLKISVVTGDGTEICKTAKQSGYNSSTFTRESIIYLSRTGFIDRMDPNTCEITEVGATWYDELQIVYSINGTDDSLYEIDRTTGFATYLADLVDENGDPFDFGSVGIELHPLNGQIYACSGAAKELLHIDPSTGVVTKIGTGMGHEKTDCDNLGAPWKNVINKE